MIKNFHNYLLVISIFIFNSIAVFTYGNTNASFIFPQNEVIKDEEGIPIKRTLINYLIDSKLNEKSLHTKRDDTNNIDIKALKAAVENNRFSIDDHKLIINNIINSSINSNNVQEVVHKFYKTMPPVLYSWRDLLLIVIVLIIIIRILFYCICNIKLRPFDYLVSLILQRHNKRHSLWEETMSRPSTRNNNNKTATRQPKRSEYQSNAVEVPISNIEQEYKDCRIDRL